MDVTFVLSCFFRLVHYLMLQIRIIDDDMPLAQFAVVFSAASWNDPDYIALMVMQSMLGSGNKNANGGKQMENVDRLHFTFLRLSLCSMEHNNDFCKCISLSFNLIINSTF